MINKDKGAYVGATAAATLDKAIIGVKERPIKYINDPIELIILEALEAANIDFSVVNEKGLDFYLPDAGIYIECKQYYSERADKQLQRADNIILIQGKQAALTFARMIGELR